MPRPIASVLVLMLCVSLFSTPAVAQMMVRPSYGVRHYGPPPPPYPYRRGPSDFDKALAVVGTVGAIAAIANARNNYYRQPAVVVAPQRPTVVVRQPSPVIVEKQVVIEKPVVVERKVPVLINSGGAFSPKLGASFCIENMQIPGYKFTAARLMSDPLSDSPLNSIGLRKGDVITRLDDSPADSLAELERHDKNTAIRYIKTGTTKVLLANIYIPTHADTFDNSSYNAP